MGIRDGIGGGDEEAAADGQAGPASGGDDLRRACRGRRRERLRLGVGRPVHRLGGWRFQSAEERREVGRVQQREETSGHRGRGRQAVTDDTQGNRLARLGRDRRAEPNTDHPGQEPHEEDDVRRSHDRAARGVECPERAVAKAERQPRSGGGPEGLAEEHEHPHSEQRHERARRLLDAGQRLAKDPGQPQGEREGGRGAEQAEHGTEESGARTGHGRDREQQDHEKIDEVHGGREAYPHFVEAPRNHAVCAVLTRATGLGHALGGRVEIALAGNRRSGDAVHRRSASAGSARHGALPRGMRAERFEHLERGILDGLGRVVVGTCASTAASAPAASAGTALEDACGLLTDEEIESVTAYPVETSQAAGGLSPIGCQWDLDEGDPDLTARLRAERASDGRAVAVRRLPRITFRATAVPGLGDEAVDDGGFILAIEGDAVVGLGYPGFAFEDGIAAELVEIVLGRL